MTAVTHRSRTRAPRRADRLHRQRGRDVRRRGWFLGHARVRLAALRVGSGAHVPARSTKLRPERDPARVQRRRHRVHARDTCRRQHVLRRHVRGPVRAGRVEHSYIGCDYWFASTLNSQLGWFPRTCSIRRRGRRRRLPVRGRGREPADDSRAGHGQRRRAERHGADRGARSAGDRSAAVGPGRVAKSLSATRAGHRSVGARARRRVPPGEQRSDHRLPVQRAELPRRAQCALQSGDRPDVLLVHQRCVAVAAEQRAHGQLHGLAWPSERCGTPGCGRSVSSAGVPDDRGTCGHVDERHRAFHGRCRRGHGRPATAAGGTITQTSTRATCSNWFRADDRALHDSPQPIATWTSSVHPSTRARPTRRTI